jgi:hypothetical protein
MALSKKITVNTHGATVEFPSAYCKVISIIGTKETMTATMSTLSEKDGELIQSTSFQFVPDLEGKNFIAQAYEYLKTLPEFADATDV